MSGRAAASMCGKSLGCRATDPCRNCLLTIQFHFKVNDVAYFDSDGYVRLLLSLEHPETEPNMSCVQYQAEPYDETMPPSCVLWNNIEFRNYVDGHEFYGPLHRGMGSAMRPRMLLDEPTPKYWIESWADPELRTLAAVCVAEIRMAWNKPPASDDDDDEEQQPAEDSTLSMDTSNAALPVRRGPRKKVIVDGRAIDVSLAKRQCATPCKP
jgi:hypothetical protein